MHVKKSILLKQLLISILLSAFCVAQGTYFGRNKVQYNEFDWHILKTDHFDIYYYPEMQDIAEKGAKFAEDSYDVLQTKFNHTINRRIPLIFYSSHLHFQQTNITQGFIPEGVGGFFEFLKGRVVIPSNGNLNQFKKVIRHELVHVFMHSKVSRVHKNHGKISGLFPPLWFTEGLAELWSTKWDAQADMVVKDAVLKNYMVPLSQLYRIQGTYMMYKVGQNILEYIVKHFGEDKILLLMENVWKSSKFSEVFQQTIGLSYQEFDKQYIYSLKKKYYPQLSTHDFSSIVSETLVKEGYNFKPAYYDQDGKPYVVFVANRTGYSSVYMRPLQALKINQDDDAEILIKGEETADFEAFHPFSSSIDVNARGILTFATKSGESDALYVYDIAERRVLNKYYFDNMVGILSPSWSPDGNKIVFSGLHFNGYKDLYIFDTQSGELLQLTNDFYDDVDPAWSADGNFIVFSSDRTDYGKQWSYNIFLMNVNSGEINYITHGKQRDTAPHFSPDGNYIAYTSDRDTTLNIYITKLDASKRPVEHYKFTHFANATFDPSWTPEGGLLFGVFEGGRFLIRHQPDVIKNLKPENQISFSFVRPSVIPWKFDNISADERKTDIRYTKDYSLDIMQSQVSNDPIFGTSGGAQVAFSDILGNDQYHIIVYNNASTSDEFLRSFNFAVSKVSLEKRINYAYGVFRFAGRYFNFQDAFYYEDRIGGFLALSYPLSQFMRLEYNTSYSYSDRERFIGGRRQAYLASNFFSFVKDNSLWSASGPIEGQRIKFTLGNTFDARFSNVNYYTFYADYRQYFRLGLRSAWAIRAMTLLNEGREARQFYLGGSWDMRGYPRWSIRGRKLAFISNELRFPFIDLLGIRFPFGSIGFNSIRGALFFDAGNAWDDQLDSLLGSFGMGVRMRLVGFLVLRLDVGKTTDFHHVSNGLFTQFFFGWDF